MEGILSTHLHFLNERKEAISRKISPLERSEKDRVLPRRNSGKREKAGQKAYSVLKCLIY